MFWLLILCVVAVLALGVILFFFLGKKESTGSSNGQASAFSDEEGPLEEQAFLPTTVSSSPHEPEAEEVVFIDVSHLERPSPERPITDEDAALIDIIRQSPELPSAIMELSQMLRDPEANIRRVVELISTDPVLSAKVLRVVNSAAYGQLRVTSLQQAVVLLGFNNVWLLVTQMLTSSAVKPFAELDQQEIKALWRHAAAASVCARHLLFFTGMTTSQIGPTVFTCSLLHDVGKFLLKGLGGGQEHMDKEQPCETFSVLEEEQVYGLDHCRMGYLLSTYWKLPELICTTIGYHHHPSFGNWHEVPRHARKTVAFVALSDFLAKKTNYWDESPCGFNISQDALEFIGLDKPGSINKLLTKELKRDLRQTEALIEAAAKRV